MDTESEALARRRTVEAHLMAKITQVLKAEERMLEAHEMVAYEALAIQEARLFDLWRAVKDA